MLDMFKGMTPEQLAEMAYQRSPTANPVAIGQALMSAPNPQQQMYPQVGQMQAAQRPTFEGLGGAPAAPPETGTFAGAGPSTPPAVNPTANPMAAYLPYMLDAMKSSQSGLPKGTMGTPMLGAAPKAPVNTPQPTARAGKMQSLGQLISGR